ncbi:MAG: hypothetical protein J5822_05160 [Eubacteriaceae bacterium]|nr:hypothetical protein [Eubacteriaceae bacterium]
MDIQIISIAASLLMSLAALAFSVITFNASVRHQRKKDTIDAFNTLQNDALDPLLGFTKKQIEAVAMDP